MVVVGILLAAGRRTAARGWRAAGSGDRLRSYSSLLGSVGRQVMELAAVLRRIVRLRIPATDRLVFAIDDTPTKREGPKVQDAGLPHHPTPGPAGSKFLAGQSGVVLSRLVRHTTFGGSGVPLRGHLSIPKKEVPTLPAQAGITFGTKSAWAADGVGWLRSQLPAETSPPWVVVEGGSAQREFLKPAQRAGFVGVARLRKEAALDDLPPVIPPGQKRPGGRPPISGKNRLRLAQRAGQTRGWETIAVRTTTAQVVRKQLKTLLATWRPAGEVVRVVISREEDGGGRASLGTDPQAGGEAIVPVALDRWGIEPNFHDLQEVEGIEPGQLPRVWSHGGALKLNLWVPTLVEIWGWHRSAGPLSDRSDRPWEDAERRPWPADRRRAVQRAMGEEAFQRISIPGGSTPRNRGHAATGMTARSRPGGRPRRLGATQGGGGIE